MHGIQIYGCSGFGGSVVCIFLKYSLALVRGVFLRERWLVCCYLCPWQAADRLPHHYSLRRSTCIYQQRLCMLRWLVLCRTIHQCVLGLPLKSVRACLIILISRKYNLVSARTWRILPIR